MRFLSWSLCSVGLVVGGLVTGCDSVEKLVSRQGEAQALASETVPPRAAGPVPAPPRPSVAAPAGSATPAAASVTPAASPVTPGRAEAKAACQPAGVATGVNSSQGGDATEQRFAFNDEQYLLPNQKQGGLVYVPDSVPAGASVPLVIFLHGTNANGPLHRGLGSGRSVLTSSGEIEAGYDLRPVIEALIDQKAIAPVMVGGPSQTREAAKGHDLWPDFDPNAFADAAERSLGDRARVDRERLIVVGHSGAGCSPVGGGLVGLAQRLGRSSQQVPPRAIVAIDTCLDDFVAEAFADAAQVTSVWVYYQSASWERPFDDFRSRFLPTGSDVPGASADEPARRRVVTLEGLSGDAAHNLALPRGLRLALPGLVPPRVCP